VLATDLIIAPIEDGDADAATFDIDGIALVAKVSVVH
jgi:hypothetical protein